MSSANLLTIAIITLLFHGIVAFVFSRLIIGKEPYWRRMLPLLVLVWLVPILGAAIAFRSLELNWFRNDDGSQRTGGIAFSFLELDAIFNPASREVLQEQQRIKTESKKQGKDLGNPEHAK